MILNHFHYLRFKQIYHFLIKVGGGAKVQVTDGTGDLTFQFYDFTDGATTMNGTNNRILNTIAFDANPNQFVIVASATISSSLDGKWIQISSHFMDADGTNLKTTAARTRKESTGRVIGWWKVPTGGHSGTTITLDYTHGLVVGDNYTFGGSNNPIYITFDTSSSNIPVLAVPYAITATNDIIEDVVYDDTTTAFELTNAINRGVRDLKMAFNRVMVEETVPWAFARSGATEGNGRILFESALPGKTLTTTVTEAGSTDLEIFVDNIKRVSGTAVAGPATVLPSRLLISAPNYPEMFDNPFGVSAVDSDSLLDINANDGQEIT